MLWLMNHPNVFLGLMVVVMPAALLLAVCLTAAVVVLPFAALL